ncbi:MAG: RluA family pseudouridine synthase, partial [Actinobacteria bacterium]|nr:RluA family pseudouridine synthase [Actinomycetota bacterium]
MSGRVVIERPVSAEMAGSRLDVVVGAIPEVGSRSRAEVLVAEGLVLVDGIARPRSYRVREGQVVRVEVPDSAHDSGDDLTAEDIPVPIVYEDVWLLVVDKPAGL